MLGGGSGQVFAGEGMRGGLGGHHGRSCAACGEVLASGDRELEDAMGECGFRAGGSALGEADANGGFGAGVSEEQVLDDLLDAPLVGVEGWLELGLSGVEAVEGGGDLALELV